MISAWIAVPAAIAVVIGYLVVRRVLGRQPRIVPAAATPDLRDEPPAVVNLLVNGGRGAPQGASATLLDLAARRLVELHQVADDPAHTLVRLRGPVLPADAPGYEKRVVERIAAAGSAATPVAALVARYADGGDVWQRRVARDAVLDARRRGLVTAAGLGCGPAFAAAGIAAAVLLAPAWPSAGSDFAGALGLGLVGVWLVLLLVGGLLLSAVTVGERPMAPERLTAAGREAVAHWLGVAAWLRAHPTLRDLPPGAVAVWDRYLAYGVALDVMPHAVRVLDFETVGLRDVVTVHRGGRPVEIPVHYQRMRRFLRPGLGVSARARLVWAAATLPVWLVALVLAAIAPWPVYLRIAIAVVVGAQALHMAYRLVRAIIDVARPVRLTGTVVAVSTAGRQPSADETQPDGPAIPDLPTHFYIVVDDGRSGVLSPWIINRDLARGREPGLIPIWDPTQMPEWLDELARPFFRVGDPVHLVGEGWSRFVTSLTPAEAHVGRH